MQPNALKMILSEAGESACQVFFDPEGRVIYANDHFRNAIPLTKDSRIDPKGHSILQPADRKRLVFSVMECLSKPDGEVDLEIPDSHSNGYRACRWKLVSLADKTGRILGVYGEGIDIRADIRNRMRELLASEMLDKVADAVIFTDPDFNILIWNKTAEEHYEISAEDAVGKKFNEIIHFEQPTEEYEAMQVALKTSGEWDGEVTYTRKDGQHIVIWIRSKLVKDNDGKVLGFLGMGREVTDMKRSGQNLQERAGLLQNLSEAVAYMDPDLNIRTINRAGEELFGVTQDHALGRKMEELVNIHLPDGLDIDRLGDILLAENRWEGDFDLQRPDGITIHLHGSIVTIRDDRSEPIGYLTVCRDITDQLHAQDDKNLRDLVLGNILDGVVTTDAEGRIITYNTHAGRIFGVCPDEATGKTLQEIAEFHDHSDEAEIQTAMMKSGFWEGQAKINTVDGRSLVIEIRTQQMNDHAGHFLANLHLVRDINSKVLNEERRHQHLELLNNIEDIIISTDKDFHITAINKAAERTLGIREKDVIGQLDMDAIPYTFLTDNLWKATRMLKETGRWQGRVAFPLDDGRLIYLSSLVTAIHDGQGNLTGYIEVHRNITERMESEKRDRYNAILLDNIEDAVVAYDHEFRIVSINKAAQNMYDVRPFEVSGQMVRDAIPWELHGTDEKAYQSAIILSGHWSGEASHTRKDGSRLIISATTNRITGDQGEIVGFVTVSRDITGRKDEEKRQQFNSLLMKSLSNGVIALSPTMAIQSMNPAAETIFGFTEAAAKGKVIIDIISLNFFETPFREINQVVLEKGSWNGSCRFRRADGKNITLNMTISVIRDDKDNITGFVTVSRDITDRVAEEDRRRFNSMLMDNIHDGVVALDIEARIQSMNPAAEEFFGVKKEEVIGKIASEILPLDYLDSSLQLNKSYLEDHGAWSGRVRYVRKNGKSITMYSRMNTLFNEQGKFTNIVCLFHDISATIEEELRQRANSIMMRSISDVIVSLDKEMRVATMNPAAEKLLGKKLQDIIGTPVMDSLPLEFKNGSYEGAIAQLKERGSWNGETIYRHPEGYAVYFLSLLNILNDDRGELTGIVGIHHDISAQQAERKQAQYNALLLDNMSDGVVSMLPDFTILGVNAAAEKATGYTNAELVGKNANDIIPLDFMGIPLEAVTADVSTKGSWTGRTRYYHPDGMTAELMTTVNAILDDKGQFAGVVTVNRDITDQVEEERRQQYNMLLMRNIREVIVAMDPENKVTYMNPWAEELLGHELQEVIGQVAFDVMPLTFLDTQPDKVFGSLHDTDQWEGPTLYTHPDGHTILFHSRFSYMRNDDGEVTGMLTVCTDQTARQEADRNHKYNSLLLNSMTDAVVTIDGELRVTYMNPAAEKLSGLKLEDVKGKSGLEIMPAEYVDATNEEVLGAITTKGIWNGRSIFTRQDGQTVDLLTTFNTITNEKGEFEGIIAVNKDISHLRAIEETQRYNSLLMNNITDGVISLDDRFRLVTMNPAAERIFGDRQESMQGRNVNEAYDMEYLDQELPEITRIVLQHDTWSGQAILHRRDGKDVHLSAVFTALRNQEGKLTGFVGTFRDISDRIESERQQKLAADLMERVSDAVAYYDQDLHILYVNKTAEDMLDIIAEDVRGKRSVDAFLLHYVNTERQQVIEDLRKNGYWHGDATYTRPDGRVLHLHLRHRVIRDLKGGISGYISNITDTTELMDAQKAQRMAGIVMESIDDAIGYFDKDLRVIYLNHAANTTMGVAAQDAVGRLGHEVFPVEYVGTDFWSIYTIVNDIGHWSGEGYYNHPDGRRLYMNFRFSRITDANGNTTGYISTSRDITERAEMDRKIRFNALLLDKITEGVVASDKEFRVIYMNPAAQSLTGVIYEEVKGKFTTEAVDLYYPGVERKEVQRLIREEGAWTGEATCLKPDGTLVNMILTHARFTDEKGNDAGFVTVGRDISELRRTWDKLEDMSLIAQKTQNSVIISDELERIIWVNEGFTRLTGYSWQEAIGKTTIDLLTGPGTDQDTVAYIRRQLTRHEPLNAEYQMRSKDGSYRWIKVEGQPVFDEQGEFKKYFRIQTDIQEAKEHLSEVETLSLIAKHTDNMVVITDDQDRITWVNDAFVRVTGFDLLDAAGERTVNLLAGPDSSEVRNSHILGKIAQREPFRMEVLIYTKEGRSRWCSLEARPIFDESGRFTKYFRMYSDIQERKDHEQLIAESQQRLEDIFNTRFEAMAILDREGRVLNMNARAEQTSHKKKELLIGKFPWDHDFTENNNDLAAFFKRAVDTCKHGNTFHEEYRLQIPDGSIEVQVFSFRPVMDAFNNLRYIQMEVEDITEKEMAKKTSQYNEQLFNAYMRNSPVPAWITDLHGKIENMNERFLEFIGKDESVIGMNMIDVIDHTYLAQYRQHNEVVVKTQKPLQAIEYALDKDKVVHTFLNTRFPIFEDGKLTRIGGMGMDITSILKAEEERNESIQRFEAVSRATDDMIWEWDIVKDKVFWQGENKRHWVRELRTGDTMREFLDFLHKDDRDMVDSSLRRSIKNRNKDRWQAEYRMKGPHGEEVHILDRAVILRDIEGNASRMIGAMQDITDRVTLEKDFVKQQEEEHKRTTRMIFDAQEAERSRLAADLHDNVNPLLAAARLHINAAEATTEDPAPYLLQSKALIHEGIEEIRKISHNLSNTLINEISLEDLVLSTLRKLNPDETMEVHTDFRKLDALKPATSMKLNVIRIIQEQVHNTLKYAKASNLYIKLYYRDQALALTIQDDGQGFDPKALRTGIGLANIKNRVESYNGRMKLSSSPGKGCKMEINLPVD